MLQEKLITISESKKNETISRVIKKEITQKTASQILKLTVRQVRNLTKVVKKKRKRRNNSPKQRKIFK